MSSEDYIPGSCNIGNAEVIMRKKSFAIAAIVTVIITSLAVYIGENQMLIWPLLLISAAVTFIYYFQITHRFCVSYGFSGFFNFNERGKKNVIYSKEFRNMDRLRALQLVVKGTAIGLSYTIAFYFFSLVIFKSL